MDEALARALRGYDDVRDRHTAALAARGVRFAAPGAAGADEAPGSLEARIAEARARLAARGVASRNAGASLSVGWLSPACVACTGPEGSETFSTTFRCHRDCYFCFNHNQPDYERFVREGCPWEEGLATAARERPGIVAVGLTGGEPLLALDDAVRFLERAGELFPAAHKRLYTSGDLLDEDAARRLAAVGLREIRFSVKDFDPEPLQERVLAAMAVARRRIPDVMVEMPVVPGTGARMRELLARFDAIGIRGINLLEFCFPFHGWDEFARRGLVVRNPPFAVMYDYGYSGGLPIAGSEELALELMEYGIDQGFSFGMHYCSLENKHRSEMRQRNERAAGLHPCFSLDGGDFMLKAGKVFGADRAPARAALAAAGCRDFLEDADDEALLFPLAWAGALAGTEVTLARSVNLMEPGEGGTSALMEVGLELA